VYVRRRRAELHHHDRAATAVLAVHRSGDDDHVGPADRHDDDDGLDHVDDDRAATPRQPVRPRRLVR
jgi:hypothetical protein